MTTCTEHPGAVVVYTDTTCPVCQQMAFVREFEVKLLEMEQDIGEMKAKNQREMGDMTAELMDYIGRERI